MKTPQELAALRRLDNDEAVYSLFGKTKPDEKAVTDIFRRLMSFLRKHEQAEDRDSDAYDLVARLPGIRDRALDWIKSDIWTPHFSIDSADSKSEFRYSYLKKSVRADGVIRLEQNQTTLLVFPTTSAEQTKLVAKNIRAFRSFLQTTFASSDKARPLPPGIEETPKEVKVSELSSLVLAYPRPFGYINLADFIEKNGPLGIEHGVWLMSRMLQFAWFLQKANQSATTQENKVVCCPSSLEDLYISPEFHSVLVLGGFEFGKASTGKTLVPGAYAARPSVRNTKEVTEVDIVEIFKGLLLKAVGASSIASSSFPDPIKTWLYSAPSPSVLETIGEWETAKKASLPTKFVVLNYERPY